VDALLALATSLATTESVPEITTSVAAAVPAVVGADRAVVVLSDGGTTRLAGLAGFDPATENVLRRGVIRSETELLDLLGVVGVAGTLTAPIVVGHREVGAVVAAVDENPTRLHGRDTRLAALAAIASTALRYAWLVERLHHDANHDPLTGLPNRALVLDRIAGAAGERSALFIDLDGFKDVNDSLGHLAGDDLLRAVADRLRLTLRDDDLLARLGSDEFVVLPERGGGEAVAERILSVLREPFVLEAFPQVPLRVTASIGIARAEASELLRNADVALHRAKALGRDRAVMYEPEMQHAVRARLDLDRELHVALEDGQLFLVYQPILDLESEAITGVEALLRWRHPERGVIPPNDFIPQLEESGFIVDVGRWVLEQACRQTAEWHAQGIDIHLSVNVSARQLESDGVVDDVRAALGLSGLRASALTVEITETSIMSDPDATAAQLARIKELGVRVAIDDFGTGYSSLAYLRQFPVDVLKIDRSFVSAIGTSTDAMALVRTMVQLGKGLGLQTLAEGIEDRAQYDQLRAEECDSGQGFLFSRPVEPAELVALLRPSDAEGRPDAVAVPARVTP